MKTYALFQQYIWLVNTIHKAENGITLEEINQRWLANEASEGIPIARSTFIVTTLSLGIPPQVVMKWTGHSDYQAMKPYIAIAEKTKADAMKLFDEELKK